MTDRLINAVASLLDPHEREAILGDLVESGESKGGILAAVSGVFLRRQIEYWEGPLPWLCLLGVGLPLIWLLSVISRNTAESNAVFLWFTVNNVDIYLSRQGGFWHGVLDTLPTLFMSFAALASWSWTSGLLLGSCARRAALSVGAVLTTLLMISGMMDVPGLPGGPLALRDGYISHENDAVFSLGFYRWGLPFLLLVCLVWVPALWGSRAGAQSRIDRQHQGLIVWVALAVSIGSLLIHASALWQIMPRTHLLARALTMPLLLSLALMAPLVYWLIAPERNMKGKLHDSRSR